MSYLLGVDVGTTYTAAAVVTAGRAEVIPLGNRSSVVPTVVFLREDEEVLIGEAANRRSLTEPGRVAREFKRRVGDSAPILLGGSPLSPQSLMAKMLRWVVDRVAEQQGEMPAHIAVSHPANWGPYKLDLLEQATRLADLSDCTTITEPEAAAAYYASYERLEPGEAVAVYDLGGGTFDAAVVRRTEVGFDILGAPEGIEHLGGIDIDEAVFAYVRGSLQGALDDLDPTDPTTLAAVARLREECVEAKEALSGDLEVSIPVLLPSVHDQVPLTRAQLETMIRPLLGDTVTALRRALRSAQMAPDDIKAVLLVGGSSRIPLVAAMVGEELGRPVAVDTHPKHSVALGTALAAEEAVARARGLEPVAVHVVPPRPTPQPETGGAQDRSPVEQDHERTAPDTADTDTREPPAQVAAATVRSERRPPDPDTAELGVAGPAEPDTAAASDLGRPRRRVPLLAGAGTGLVIAAVAGILWLAGGEEEPETTDPAAASTEEEEPAAEEVIADEEADDEGGDDDSPLPPDASCDGTLCAGIDTVRLEDDELVVDWVAVGFEPDNAATHAHFYWDVYDAHQVGTNAESFGYERAPWELTDQQPFAPGQEMRLKNRPPGTEGVCVTVADGAHALLNPGNYHCVPLPEGAEFVATCDGQLCVEIDEVRIEGGELLVEWTPDGFEPDTSGTHAHFYWDVYESDQVGTNAEDLGAERAPWELTDQQPFVPQGEMRLANRAPDSEAICVTVADGAHAVIDPANHHCVPLPDGA